jgi:reactive chlorine resistance protein C
MRKRLMAAENLQAVGASTLRLGLALNLVAIGRLKFEDYEVENIRPLVTSHPMFARLVSKVGEEKLARLIGVTEIVIGSLIAARPLAPRASAVGSWAAAGMFTLSFLITTREAWKERRPEPKLSPTGQFLVKDIVLLGASLLTAGESLRDRRQTDPCPANDR